MRCSKHSLLCADVTKNIVCFCRYASSKHRHAKLKKRNKKTVFVENRTFENL